MTVDLTALAPWFAVALAAGSFIYTIVTNRSNNTKETTDDLDLGIEKVNERVDDKADRSTVQVLATKLDLLEDRATRIESDIRHLPDHSTVSKLEGMIGTLSKEVGILSERIRPVAAIADRLQEKILETSGFDR